MQAAVRDLVSKSSHSVFSPEPDALALHRALDAEFNWGAPCSDLIERWVKIRPLTLAHLPDPLTHHILTVESDRDAQRADRLLAGLIQARRVLAVTFPTWESFRSVQQTILGTDVAFRHSEAFAKHGKDQHKDC